MILHFLIALNLFTGIPTSSGQSNKEISSETIAKADVLKLAEANLDDTLRALYSQIDLEQYGLSYDVFRHGMIGFYSLRYEGKLNDRNLITIIDFTKPSTEKRFYTIDLDKKSMVYHTYTSHGKNTGENYAKSFSNVVHSNQSSIGFYVTGETYVGSKGFSLKLDGTESGYNDKIRERAVVIHEAEYVSEYWIKRNGRLGRSQGCPALPKELSRKIINDIKNKTVIFAYFNDETYLRSSSYLNAELLITKLQIENLVATTPIAVDSTIVARQ